MIERTLNSINKKRLSQFCLVVTSHLSAFMEIYVTIMSSGQICYDSLNWQKAVHPVSAVNWTLLVREHTWKEWCTHLEYSKPSHAKTYKFLNSPSTFPISKPINLWIDNYTNTCDVLSVSPVCANITAGAATLFHGMTTLRLKR